MRVKGCVADTEGGKKEREGSGEEKRGRQRRVREVRSPWPQRKRTAPELEDKKQKEMEVSGSNPGLKQHSLAEAEPGASAGLQEGVCPSLGHRHLGRDGRDIDSGLPGKSWQVW